MSAFCTRCGSIDGQDKSCRACGTPVAGVRVVPVPGTAEGPARTGTKPIHHLTFGIGFFSFPLSVAAIILGHLALSEIKKNAGRLTGVDLAAARLVLGCVIAEIPIFSSLLRSRFRTGCGRTWRPVNPPLWLPFGRSPLLKFLNGGASCQWLPLRVVGAE